MKICERFNCIKEIIFIILKNKCIIYGFIYIEVFGYIVDFLKCLLVCYSIVSYIVFSDDFVRILYVWG